MLIRIIIVVIWGIIWGIVCNNIIHNKNYEENWFWWGFFFGVIAFIVALTKPDNSNYQDDLNPTLSYIVREKRETEILRNGGWKCNNCGEVNADYTGTCSCGWTKFQSQKSVIEAKKEDNKIEMNGRKTEIENLDILKKYKELLDMGAISEDEFRKKKEEILFAGNNIKVADTVISQDKTEEPKEPTSWFCTNCEKENTLDRKSCKYCGAIRMKTPAYKPKPKKFDPNLADWKCLKCGAVNKCYIGICKCGVSKSQGQIIM